MKVFVSGCFDLLHSGHVKFLQEAAKLGDLYVSVGSDRTVWELKHKKTICPENERLYMVRSLRCVKEASIGSGSGHLDFVPELERVKPDVFVVNSEGHSADKERCMADRHIRYVVLERTPETGLPKRSTTSFRQLLNIENKGKK